MDQAQWKNLKDTCIFAWQLLPHEHLHMKERKRIYYLYSINPGYLKITYNKYIANITLWSKFIIGWDICNVCLFSRFWFNCPFAKLKLTLEDLLSNLPLPEGTSPVPDGIACKASKLSKSFMQLPARFCLLLKRKLNATSLYMLPTIYQNTLRQLYCLYACVDGKTICSLSSETLFQRH